MICYNLCLLSTTEKRLFGPWLILMFLKLMDGKMLKDSHFKVLG